MTARASSHLDQLGKKVKYCHYCKYPFYPKSMRTKYCSKICKSKFYWRNRSDKRKEQKKIADKKYAQSEKGKLSHDKARKKYLEKPENEKIVKQAQKRWLKTEKGKAYKKAKDKRYWLKHHDKIRERQRIWERNKYMADHEYRLKINKKREVLKTSRRYLYELIYEQKNICPLCKQNMPNDTLNIHVDHILPRSKGGGNEKINLQATHSFCNIRKQDKN